MQLIIDIPEETVKAIQNGEDYRYDIHTAIAQGTPLPKGHGRLIDADALEMDKRVCGERYLSGSTLFVANKVIEQAPTIIEAGKGDAENG